MSAFIHHHPPQGKPMTNPRSGLAYTSDDELFWGAAHDSEAALSLPPVQAHSATPRSCDVLGLCQAQFGKPACPGCTHATGSHRTRHNTRHLGPGQFFFAPGAIEGGPRRVLRRHRVRALVRLALWLAVALALVATVLLASYGLGHALVRFGGGVL